MRAHIDAATNAKHYVTKLKEAVGIIETVGINASLAVKRNTSLSLSQVPRDMKREVCFECSLLFLLVQMARSPNSNKLRVVVG